MKILNLKKAKKVIERVILKKIKHSDNNIALSADFYLDNKLMGTFCDDGVGGDPKITFKTKEHQEKFENFLKENEFSKLMLQCEWKSMKDFNKISMYYQIEQIILLSYELNILGQEERKLERLCENGIYYSTDSGYKGIEFRIPLKQIVLKENGKQFLQKHYDAIKSSLKKNEYIVNKNLKKIGVVS
ncbi:MAG: hypothetical protein WC466_06340 [Candidatus Izemoplasmatales bacterium]